MFRLCNTCALPQIQEMPQQGAVAKALPRPLRTNRGFRNPVSTMDAHNYDEIHADHIMRNVLGDGEAPSLPDDPTEEDVKQRNPAMIWSHWRDDAAFRSQLLFENTYKELGVPHSVECDALSLIHI